MSPATGAPQQPRQPSRKGKKAWRKHVDISQVQQGIESLRDQIIQGGPVAEKPSDELFAFDSRGSDNIKQKYKLHKPLKVDEILTRRSAVPALTARKRGYSRLGDGIVEPASRKAKTDWVSKKEVQQLRRTINAVSHLHANYIDNEASSFDLWADDASMVPATTMSNEYIPAPRSKVAPPTLKRAPIAMTASGKGVRTVPQPEAGTSYNPSFDEWDDLLNREGEREVQAEEARLQAARVAAEQEVRIAAIAAQPEPDPADDESAWEGFDTDNDDAQMLKHKRPERKTPAQRNKIKRRKEAERLAKHEKRMKAKQQQAEQALSALVQQATAEMQAQMADTPLDPSARQDNDDDRVLRRRKLGNTAIPEKPLELVLPDELQESLRRLKPEGNLLNDRFRALLVNGKVEARKPVLNPKKKKRTYTEKWSYKDFRVQV